MYKVILGILFAYFFILASTGHIGAGTGKPLVVLVSIHNAMACCRFSSASISVSPSAMQPSNSMMWLV